jgi:hypothetical protein
MVAVGLEVSSEMGNGAVAEQSMDCDRRTRATPAFFTQARALAHGRLRLPIDSFEFIQFLYLQDKPPTHTLSRALLLILKKREQPSTKIDRLNSKIISEVEIIGTPRVTTFQLAFLSALHTSLFLYRGFVPMIGKPCGFTRR